tara:strand:+ start:2571 stop:2780 length:210 start_codon:yes stop_codon:yes gene_type:complete
MNIRDYWREIEAALGYNCEAIVNPAGQGWHVYIKRYEGPSGIIIGQGQAPMLPAAVLEALKAAHKRVVG